MALPSYAATAWFHHKVPGAPAPLEPWLHEVERYALGEYASALLAGADLTPEAKGRSRQSWRVTRAFRQRPG